MKDMFAVIGAWFVFVGVAFDPSAFWFAVVMFCLTIIMLLIERREREI